MLESAGIQLFIKREDLNNPLIQGNKWHKLLPNLHYAREHHYTTLLTFGGCYSNHILATAMAGKAYGFATVGIIRGPEPVTWSPTLKSSQAAGMELHFIDRQSYRLKESATTVEKIINGYKNTYLVPEGGSNALAIKGVSDFARTLASDEFDLVCSACGTGGTLAGIIAANPECSVLGFPVLKGGDFLHAEIEQFLHNSNIEATANWSLCSDYHFGGYGKTTTELNRFILNFYQQHEVPLEPVYTGKLIYALFDMAKKKQFSPGTKILAIHTGGLQGLAGFPDLLEEMKMAGYKPATPV